MQSIYSWIPRTNDIQLIAHNGLGTIRSIDFDPYANNLYWIDPMVNIIKIMNMDTLLTMDLLDGNYSYSPYDLTLIPIKG